jgi:hypothetical protein
VNSVDDIVMRIARFEVIISGLRLLCGAGGYPPNVLQPTKAHCTNPALVPPPPLHLQRRSTLDDVRGLY